jgi:hypothetical protein
MKVTKLLRKVTMEQNSIKTTEKLDERHIYILKKTGLCIVHKLTEANR